MLRKRKEDPHQTQAKKDDPAHSLSDEVGRLPANNIQERPRIC